MDLIVRDHNGKWTVRFGKDTWVCAIGRSGISTDKWEGDGATPVGRWPLRRLLYRPDRVATPTTKLPTLEITKDDGWCDDPACAEYNRPVTLPFSGSHERLWREDHLYDLVVVLGHNDDPPVPGKGSAIFLHVAGPGYAPTEGCVALSKPHLIEVLRTADSTTRVCVKED